ncbi:murein biosynthesis integral membrane protein MurJ, partial [Streptomyces sp. ZG43]
MNAPYNGDRGQRADGSVPQGDRPEPPPVPPEPGGPTGEGFPQQPGPDPYLQHAYEQDPYRAHDLSAQDPVGEALYDRASHPPPAGPPPAPVYGPPQPEQP